MKLIKIANNDCLNEIVETLDKFFKKNKDKAISIEFKKVKDIRTTLQNRAMHKWFTLICDDINEQGHTISYKAGTFVFERKFKPEDIKEIFRTVMRTVTNKESTADLTKQELAECEDPFIKCIVDNWDVYVPFPCEDELTLKYEQSK